MDSKNCKYCWCKLWIHDTTCECNCHKPMNSIQKIESAVYAIRPELKELSFGCRVMLQGKQYTFCWLWYQENSLYKFIVDESPYMTETVDDLEIIGHPITLQDILLAMSKNLKKWDVLNAHLNSYYSLCFRSDDYPGLKDYNLRLSPYDQSKEVKDFIANNTVWKI